MRTRTVLSVAFMTAAVAPVMGVPTPYQDMPISGEVTRSVDEKNPFLWPMFKNDPNGPPQIPAKREEDLKTEITSVMNDAVQQGLMTQDEAHSLVQLFTTPEGLQFLQELEADIPANGTENHPTSEVAARRIGAGTLANGLFSGVSTIASLADSLWGSKASSLSLPVRRRIGAGTLVNGLFDGVSTAASLADIFESNKGAHARRRIGAGTLANGLFDGISTAASLADLFGGNKGTHARRRIGAGTLVNGALGGVSTAASLADYIWGSKGSHVRRELYGDPNLLPDEVVNMLMAKREADDISRRDTWLHDILEGAYEASGALKRDEFSNLRRDWRDELQYDEIVKSSGEKRDMPESTPVDSFLQDFQPFRTAQPEANLD